MTTRLYGKAPLTVVHLHDGSLAYVYQGSPVPDNAVIDTAEHDRLIAGNFLEERDDDSAPSTGAGDTATFIGRATADTSGAQFEMTFEADGEVDWARAVDGRIQCDGPIVVRMMYRYVARLDFTDAAGFSTDAQSPDTDVTVLLARVPGAEPGAANAGGPYSFVPTGTPGIVFDIDAVEEGITQTQRAAANELLTIKATINSFGYDAESSPVTDGVLTGALTIVITRLPLPAAPSIA